MTRLVPSLLLSTAWLALLAAPPRSSAADPTAAGDAPASRHAAERAPQPEGPLPLFYLRDGSQVAGRAKFETMGVSTRYGRLAVPQGELVRIRFARRVDPAIRSRVESLLSRLGDEDFDTREEAMEALRRIGPPAIPVLREAMDADDEEVQNRAEILVEEIEEAVGPAETSEGGLSGVEGRDDEIVTSRMTIRGRVVESRITIVSRYGPLSVDVADLVGISFQRTGATQRSVDVAPTFQPPGSWCDTKLDLTRGQKLSIEASGMISVANYGVSSGPAGNTQWGGSTFGSFPMLSLVGKVGKKGKPFLVAASYRGRADRQGRLYLAIVAFSHNPGGATGKYQAKIRALPAQ